MKQIVTFFEERESISKTLNQINNNYPHIRSELLGTTFVENVRNEYTVMLEIQPELVVKLNSTELDQHLDSYMHYIKQVIKNK